MRNMSVELLTTIPVAQTNKKQPQKAESQKRFSKFEKMQPCLYPNYN